MAAVRQAQIVTSEESRGVDFTFTNGSLILKSQAADVGESRVELPIAYTGPDLTITFDPRFVSDFLKVLGPETSVKLELISSEDGPSCGPRTASPTSSCPCRGIDNSMGSTSGPLQHFASVGRVCLHCGVTPRAGERTATRSLGRHRRNRGRAADSRGGDQSRRAASGCGKRLPARRTGRIPQIGPLKNLCKSSTRNSGSGSEIFA